MDDERWDEICERWSTEGYEALSRPEKTWLNLRSLIDAVQGGGAISYFYNSGAATVDDCLEDLRTLDAEEVRSQVERICELFPGGVPVDIDERNAVINSWPDDEEESAIDSLLEEVDEALMPLMDDLENKLDQYLARSALAT